MAGAPLLVFLLVAPVLAQSKQGRTLTVEPGRALAYAVTLPREFDQNRSWPLLLVEEAIPAPALPDWIVVQPQRVDQLPSLFDSETWSKRLLRQLRIDFRVQRNRIHLLGSVRSLVVASWQPQEFRSVLVSQASGTVMLPVSLRQLAGIPIVLWDSPQNTGTHPLWQQMEPTLRGMGLTVARSGDVAIAEALARQQEAPPLPEPQRAIDAALDDFHDAAAKGDAERYFPRFAPEGVFLGTDASERWTLEAFKTFALPHFKTGSAWIFVPQVRHIEVAPGGEFGCFDEELGSASYGRCRGSGALRRIAGQWRIVQYNLTIPIPNDLASDFVARIREFEARPESRPASRAAR